jgi:hypothetical protein
VRPSENDLSWLSTFDNKNTKSSFKVGYGGFLGVVDLVSIDSEKWLFNMTQFTFGGNDSVSLMQDSNVTQVLFTLGFNGIGLPYESYKTFIS